MKPKNEILLKKDGKREYYEGYRIGKKSRWLKRQFYDDLEFRDREYGSIDKAFIRFGELLDLGQKFANESENLMLQDELSYLLRVCAKREVFFTDGLKAEPEKIGFHDIWDDVCYRRYDLGQRWAGAGLHGAWMLFAERIRLEHLPGVRFPPADPVDSFMIMTLLEYEAGRRTKEFYKNPFLFFITLAETVSDIERLGGYSIRIRPGEEEENGLYVSSEENSAKIGEIFDGYGFQMTEMQSGSFFLELKDKPECTPKSRKRGWRTHIAAEGSGYH